MLLSSLCKVAQQFIPSHLMDIQHGGLGKKHRHASYILPKFQPTIILSVIMWDKPALGAHCSERVTNRPPCVPKGKAKRGISAHLPYISIPHPIASKVATRLLGYTKRTWPDFRIWVAESNKLQQFKMWYLFHKGQLTSTSTSAQFPTLQFASV